jgi:hypothetical protein
MTDLVAPVNRPLATAERADFGDARDLVKRIIYEYYKETGTPISMLNLVLTLGDLGVITIKNVQAVRAYPSHPYRMGVAKVVEELYKAGELDGLNALPTLRERMLSHD